MATPQITALTDFADSELGAKLGFERKDSSHFVLNPVFWRWDQRVSRREKNQVLLKDGIDGYRWDDESLFLECFAHAESYKKGPLSKDLIGIVHPYYLGARHFDLLKNDTMKREYDEYARKSINFLKSGKFIFLFVSQHQHQY